MSEFEIGFILGSLFVLSIQLFGKTVIRFIESVAGDE